MDAWVEVRLVGALEIRAAVKVGGHKPRTLLALLAVHRRRLVTADEIAEVLWGSRPPRRPDAGIATVVSRLRQALGPDTLVGDRHGYRLGGSTRVDLSEAAASVAEAELQLDDRQPSACLRFAERGLALVEGGPVLADFGPRPWIEPARATQLSLLRRGRHAIAEAALRIGDAARARRPALAAIASDPLDEVAHRALMRSHVLAGQQDQAVRVYARLRAALATELGIDPAPATRDLLRSILQRDCNVGRDADVVPIP